MLTLNEIKEITGAWLPDDGIEYIEEFSIETLDIEGDDEIGYYKEVSYNKFIKIHDRVDTTVYLAEDELSAIRISHYHRRGQKYGIVIYN